MRAIIEQAHDEAWEVLNENRDVLDRLAYELLDKETLDQHQLQEIFAEVRKREKREVWLAHDDRPVSDRPPIEVPPRRQTDESTHTGSHASDHGAPGTPGAPAGQPGQPGVGQPPQPGYGQPGYPHPGHSQPPHDGQPGTPGQPGPAQPPQPPHPGQPGQPPHDGQPGVPGQPGQPPHPGEPGRPGSQGPWQDGR